MKRVVIITGTSKGIGQALARHYLGRGWVVAGCSRGVATIEHECYRHHQLDVTDETAVVRMVRGVAREHGGIDALVNNAGIAAMNHLLTTPLATARQVMDVNYVGTFLFLREAGKVMSRQRRGSVVNLTTVAVPLQLEGEAAYAASKAAVESLTRVAAREFAPFNVRVNAVGPTPVSTALTQVVPADKLRALVARQPLGRFGEFADISNVTDFFLSEQSGFITGQVLYLGGVGP